MTPVDEQNASDDSQLLHKSWIPYNVEDWENDVLKIIIGYKKEN